MADIRPDVRDDVRSMTYAEIAAARGISVKSAERLVRRRHWQRQLGNDGTVRVLVPPDEAQPARAHHLGGHQAGYPEADILPVVRAAVREAIQPLTEQLHAATERADHAEQRADTERTRAERAEQQVTALQYELAVARLAERIKTDEAADLRDRLSAEIEERRQAQAQLTDLLSRRRWWYWRRPWRGSPAASGDS